MLHVVAYVTAFALGVLLSGSTGAAFAGAPPADAQPVVLQLRWWPQFQFAEYYVALWEGYYRDAGLDVEIRPAHDENGRFRSATEEVATGRADFGIGSADILVAREHGDDLVVLKSLFQTSPATLFVRQMAPFRTLADLRNLPVWRQPGDVLDIELQAMLLAQNIDPREVPYADLDQMPQEAPAFMGYRLSAPYVLEQEDIAVRTIRPQDYGVNFYGDSLFTTRAMIEQQPETVTAFVQASLRGWDYALRHPHLVAHRLAETFGVPLPDIDPVGYNLFQIKPVTALTGYPVVELGHVNSERWMRMNETLMRLGLVSTALEPQDFIFDEVRMAEERQRDLRQALLGIVAVLTVLLLSAAVGAAVMRRILSARSRALARSEANYRLLVDSLRDHAIFTLDPEGRVTSWNKGAERMTGYRREDILGRNHSVFFPPGDVEAGLPDHELAQARTFGRLEYEGWHVRRDGSRFWANVVLSSLRDPSGAFQGYAVISRDRSRRKAQDDRIRFQAALLNRVHSAIIAVNAQGRVVYMNAYAEALFLLPWREAKDRTLEELGLLPEVPAGPDVRNQPAEQEVTARRRDGTVFSALCLASVTPDPSGLGHSAVYVIHDLTERKKMEAALQHASNLALLGRMSASLVHEISQPMNVIRLTAEGGLLHLSSGRIDTEDLGHRLRTISEQAARLFDTIDFMQTFSRPDAAKGTKALGPPFDVRLSVRRAADMMADRYASEGVTLDLQLPDTPAVVQGRDRQLEQVLLNMLGNALQALAQRPEQVERRVRITVTVPDVLPGDVVLRIEDSGPGIQPDLRAQIFEPFFTTKPPGQGTGLGLSISLGILRAMKGTVDVGDSKDLGGACFEIRLPAVDADTTTDTETARPERERSERTAAPAPPTHGVARPKAPAPPHVLVVDDEELARRQVADYLATRGFRLSEASSGNEALDIVARANADVTGGAQDPIDAVITDIRMPNGNGIDLINRLSQDYPQVFSLVMTGQPLEEREELEIGSDADVVLRKPLSLEDLEARLRDLLEREPPDDEPDTTGGAPPGNGPNRDGNGHNTPPCGGLGLH